MNVLNGLKAASLQLTVSSAEVMMVTKATAKLKVKG